MTTYQDLEAVANSGQDKIDFVKRVVAEHESSELYTNAAIADDYIRGQNREAKVHVNYLTTSTGQQKVDNYSPNNKTARSFFRILLMGDVQYILGNGVKWNNKEQVEKVLGQDFDIRLSDTLTYAKAHSISFGYFNYNHVETFPVRTKSGGFAPLYDSENGSLRAGVKFWYFNEGKSLRANLYEESGISSYLWNEDNAGILLKEEPYVIKTSITNGNVTVEPGENYPGFPIIPLYGNTFHESELFLGLKDLIDEYDRLANNIANDLDNANIYWIIKGAGGADNEDLARFLDQLRSLKAAQTDDVEVQPVPVQIPIEARMAELQRLERAIYDDYMGLNFKDIVSGAATATQIRAAYEPVKNKANDTEKCLLDFLYKLLAIAGIEGESPSFEPDPIKNVSEETNAIIAQAQFMPRDYTVSELLYLRGDGDKIPDILDELDKEDRQRMSGIGLDTGEDEQAQQESGEENAIL